MSPDRTGTEKDWSGREDLNLRPFEPPTPLVPNQAVEISNALQVPHLRPAPRQELALSWSMVHTCLAEIAAVGAYEAFASPFDASEA